MPRKQAQNFEPDSAGGAKLFVKMMAVLNCFTRTQGHLTISEIMERTGLPRTTVHRIVASLRDVALLDQDGRRQSYRLGLQMFYFGSVVIANLDLNTHAHPHILELHQLTGEIVHLHIFDGSHMVCIEREEMDEQRLTTLTTIEAAPTYCTGVGKAFLAFQGGELTERIAREESFTARTAKTICTLPELEAELARIREQGYAIDDEENEIGIRCIGAPIRDSRGRVFAAISVSSTTERMPMSRVAGLAPVVVRTAGKISTSLGWAGQV
ncbi:MAG: IclR family transcriptional regulator [Tropicimonas sp.]|uniref:IclR family transcriptional regulator n=1 Tax=Tropicimonas sp. TaxID=2067044 RepID=UPI003A860DC9